MAFLLRVLPLWHRGLVVSANTHIPVPTWPVSTDGEVLLANAPLGTNAVPKCTHHGPKTNVDTHTSTLSLISIPTPYSLRF